MGASNSKNGKLEDLYFEEITVSKISTQYQTESKNMKIKDDFVQNLSQESKSNETQNFSTFVPSISQMKKRHEYAADDFSSDEMESDDSYDWDSDDCERDVLPLETLLARSTAARSRGFILKKCQPGGTNPTLGVRNFEMSSELSEMNYEVTTVNTSAIQS